MANAADADDACQDALIAIVRGLPSFDRRAAFTTWIYRVTTNACLDELRRRNRRPEPGLTDNPAPIAEPVDDAAPLDDTVSTRADIDAALASIPVEFRAAVVLRDLCGLNYDEIAETLGIPSGTVRSRIARGRAALMPLLAPGNPEQRPSPGNPAASSGRPNP